MKNFLPIKVLIAAVVVLSSVLCQYQQQFPAPAHFTIQQHHQHPHPQSHQNYQHNPPTFDFEKFNQQAKQLQAQVALFNQQQQRHIQQQINNVHEDGNEPHFDFIVNENYTDLEKQSEQFVNIGHMAGKQNVAPKVIKITKTVAVKQPVPVPYPVPVVVNQKEAVETSNSGNSGLHYPSSTSSPPSVSTNYVTRHPQLEHQPSDVFEKSFSSSSAHEFDTEPFYVHTADKEMIKIIPVPYFVDEFGNKHEIKTQSHPSTTPAPHSYFSTPTPSPSTYFSNQPSTAAPETHGKFQSFTFSYHPPSHGSLQFQSQSTTAPDINYSYDSDNSASTDQSQLYLDEQNHENDGERHYQYKYVTYE